MILKSALKKLEGRVQRSDSSRNAASLVNEYGDILQKLLGEFQGPRTIVLIDALDECGNNTVRTLADFFRELTYMAYENGQELHVCLSSRTGSAIPIKNCPSIEIDKENLRDIKSYMEFKFDAYLSGTGSEKNLRLENLVTTVAKKSSGIFLWVSLVVDMLLGELDKGINLKVLEKRLVEVPSVLQDLYMDLLKSSPTDHDLKRRVFQWAIFGGDLRLREWQHLLPLLEDSPTSLQGCQESKHWAETEIQLENQIRYLSMGLIEVVTPPEINQNEFDFTDGFSITGVAGSMDLELGETRMVRVIHDTVRDWFVSGPGFALLGLEFRWNARGLAYFSIIHTCLDFIAFKEFDLLVDARLEQRTNPTRSDIKPHGREGSRVRDRGKRPRTPNIDSTKSPADTPDDDIGSFSSAASHLYASSVGSYGSSLGETKIGKKEEERGRARTRRPFDTANAKASIKAKPTGGFDQSATSTWKDNSFSPEKDLTTPEEMRQYRLNNLFPRQAERELALDIASHDIRISEAPSTRALEKYTYPPLLDFVLAHLPAFAKFANDTVIDPSQVLLRLREPSQWQRFVCLREDMPHDLDFKSWLAGQNLFYWEMWNSWWLENCDTTRDFGVPSIGN
ncbi:hypothetical protein NUW58_g6428 [Xylaria curta]|uniref:Uncharacterized protein n=1 Tax=Xylaria curta TaxID=42375 RepID=A0ACC1NTW2_9PEZI|nr:hypothetical protein NUW58_g6428 [Xylaria curta]